MKKYMASIEDEASELVFEIETCGAEDNTKLVGVIENSAVLSLVLRGTSETPHKNKLLKYRL